MVDTTDVNIRVLVYYKTCTKTKKNGERPKPKQKKNHQMKGKENFVPRLNRLQ